MTVSNTPPSLQSILSRLEAGTPIVPPRTDGPRTEAPTQRDAAASTRSAAAEPRVTLPKDATSLDPNAPRGTYLNLTV